MDVPTRRESGSESIVRGRRPSGSRPHNFRTHGSQFDLCRSYCDDRLGVGLLLCDAAVRSQVNVLPGKYSATEGDLASFSTGWSTVFLAGFVGIVLGVLARFSVSSTQLVGAAR
jgi:hypothetical protein